MSKKESIVDVLRPVWILGQIFGLSFSNSDEKIKSDKQSVTRIVFKLVYSCISVLVTLYMSIQNFDVSIDPNKNFVIQSADILNQLSSVAAAMGTVLTSLIYQDRITMLVKRVDDIDTRLRRFPKWTNYRNICICSYGVITFTFLSWTYFCISYMNSCSGSFFECSSIFLIVFTMTKIFDISLLRFQVQMLIMWHQFRIINNNILHLSTKKLPDSVSFLEEIKKIDAIEKLKRIYMDVLGRSKETSEIYSIPLLLIISNQFISLFSSMYFCFFGYYIAGVYIKPVTLQDLVVPVMSSVHPIGQLLATTIICQSTVYQSKYTALLLYRIPVNRRSKMLMKKINLFSLHILHQEFDITAGGFISINCSLLLMIVSAVTVYLVMFIQFDLAAGKQTMH
ncbi:hypothetical protein JTB14_004374 [Gonioctena quinquepunctata]|nr:hypothetical protein JTB14_004374 [Gonioctena quinquepunctata]